MASGHAGLAAIADALDARRGSILARWEDRVHRDQSLRTTSDWTRKQFYDHFPDVLEAYGRMLRSHPEPARTAESDQFTHAHAHAKTRWLQGYALRDLIREWGHFNTSVVLAFGELREANTAEQPDCSVAETLWADLASRQLTESAHEYQRLHQAVAATRAEELSSMLERLRSMHHARAQTLARTASTLRNHLSALMTSNSLMAEGMSGADAEEVHAIARDSIGSLDRSLSDMTLLARLEAGLEKRDIRSFDVGAALSALVSALDPQVRESNSQLTCAGPAELRVEGDELAIRQIAQHLVLTGLLSDTPGPVDLEWGDDPREAARWQMVVRQHLMARSTPSSPPITRVIADASDRVGQARGIAPTGFEAALQEGLIPVASRDGSNLLIAKHLCELLDASIELTAEEGVVTFRVSFPRRYSEADDGGEVV
ncbi:HAMP domain-containing histidine kinase [Cognatilysobacter terrigena]|uniref:HAMP domain-containing histidine kinase n=1 Tax=Cognatilysobacter terrigena TaxID=2488749 RepID=UPI00105ED0A6|nr:HAMP domain-containing histidine kinase [Lysobacter terrigena]